MFFKAVYGSCGVIGITIGGGGAWHIIDMPPAILQGLICLSVSIVFFWIACYGTGSVSCHSVFILHLCRFLNQEEFMEREAMLQNP